MAVDELRFDKRNLGEYEPTYYTGRIFSSEKRIKPKKKKKKLNPNLKECPNCGKVQNKNNEKCETCKYEFNTAERIIRIINNQPAQDKILLIVNNNEKLQHLKSAIKDNDLQKTLKILYKADCGELSEGFVSAEIHDEITNLININKLLHYNYDIPIYNNIYSSRYLSNLFLLNNNLKYIDLEIQDLNNFIKTFQEYISLIKSMEIEYNNISDFDKILNKFFSIKPHLYQFNEYVDQLYELYDIYGINISEDFNKNFELINELEILNKKPSLINEKNEIYDFINILEKYNQINNSNKDSSFYINTFKNKHHFLQELIYRYNNFISSKKIPNNNFLNIKKDFEKKGFNLLNLINFKEFYTNIESLSDSVLIKNKEYYILYEKLKEYLEKNNISLSNNFNKYLKKLNKLIRTKAKQKKISKKDEEEYIFGLISALYQKLIDLSINVNTLDEFEKNIENINILTKKPDLIKNTSFYEFFNSLNSENSFNDINLSYEEFFNKNLEDFLEIFNAFFIKFQDKYEIDSCDEILTELDSIKNIINELKIDINSININELETKIFNQSNSQAVLNKYNVNDLTHLKEILLEKFNHSRSSIDLQINELINSSDNLDILIKNFSQIEEKCEKLSKLVDISKIQKFGDIDIIIEIITLLENKPTYIDDSSKFEEYIGIIDYIRQNKHVNKEILENIKIKLDDVKDTEYNKKFNELNRIINDYYLLNNDDEISELNNQLKNLNTADDSESQLDSIFNIFVEYINRSIDCSITFEKNLNLYYSQVNEYLNKYTPNSFLGLNSDIGKLKNEWNNNIKYTRFIKNGVLTEKSFTENFPELNQIQSDLITLKKDILPNITTIINPAYKFLDIETIGNLKNTSIKLYDEINKVKEICNNIDGKNLDSLFSINQINNLDLIPNLIQWNDDLLEIEEDYNKIILKRKNINLDPNDNELQSKVNTLTDSMQNIIEKLHMDAEKSESIKNFINHAYLKIKKNNSILTLKRDVEKLIEKTPKFEDKLNKINNFEYLIKYLIGFQDEIDAWENAELNKISLNMQFLKEINNIDTTDMSETISELYEKFETDYEFTKLYNEKLFDEYTLNTIKTENIENEIEDLINIFEKINTSLKQNNEKLKYKQFSEFPPIKSEKYNNTNNFYKNLNEKVKNCNLDNFNDTIIELKRELSLKEKDHKINEIIYNFKIIKEIIDLSKTLEINDAKKLFNYEYEDLIRFYHMIENNVKFSEYYDEGLFNDNIFNFYQSETFSDELEELELKLIFIQNSLEESENSTENIPNIENEYDLEKLLKIKDIIEETSNLYDNESDDISENIQNYKTVTDNLLKLCEEYPIKNNSKTNKDIKKLKKSKENLKKYSYMNAYEKEIDSYEKIINNNFSNVWNGYSTNINRIKNKFEIDIKFTSLYHDKIFSYKTIENLNNFSKSDLKTMHKLKSKISVLIEKIYDNKHYSNKNIYSNNLILINEINKLERPNISTEEYVNVFMKINTILEDEELKNLINLLKIEIKQPEDYKYIEELENQLKNYEMEYKFDENSLNQMYNDIKYTQLLDLKIINQNNLKLIKNNLNEFFEILNQFEEYRLLISERILAFEEFDLTTHFNIILNQSIDKHLFLLDENTVEKKLSKKFVDNFDKIIILNTCNGNKIKAALNETKKLYKI